MARKDEILKSFLAHEILESKYGLKKNELPLTVREALISEYPIVKAIALIVEGSDGSSPVTDKVLREQLSNYLNNHAIW
jgi:hypothetical protein